MHPAAAPPVPAAPSAATRRRLPALRAPLRARLAPVRAQKPAGDNMFSGHSSDTQAAHDAAKKAAAEAEKAAAKIREAAVPVRWPPKSGGCAAFRLALASWLGGHPCRRRLTRARPPRRAQAFTVAGETVTGAAGEHGKTLFEKARPSQAHPRSPRSRRGASWRETAAQRLIRRALRPARHTSASHSLSRGDCAPSGRDAACSAPAAPP